MASSSMDFAAAVFPSATGSWTWRWGALVNVQNQGLTVYIPSVDPYFIGFVAPDVGGSGPTDNYTNYFAPLGNLTIGPSFVFEGEFYVIAGDATLARLTVYRLHQSLSIPDIFAPYENTDQPAAGSTLSGATAVSGWAVYDVMVSKVEILIDGVVDGTAHYGDSRPDVAAAIPFSPVDVGFSYSLNTTKYADGAHTLNVRVTDSSGNIAIVPDLVVTFSNSAPGANLSEPRAIQHSGPEEHQGGSATLPPHIPRQERRW